MKGLFSIAAAVVFAAIAGISAASDSSVDGWIKDLKSDNIEVRVKAAHELGCG
jgi:hypothetical protein